MQNLKFILGLFALLVVIFWAAQAGYKKTNDLTPEQAQILTVRNTDSVSGSANAKVTIIEYLDFECEACSAYYPLTSALTEEYKDSVRLVIRYFPLATHKNSRTSAQAVEAAKRQGKFWEMYRVLFAKQKEWGEQSITNQDLFEKYAVEAGLNIEQYRKDVTSPEVIKTVADSYDEAMKLGLQGTPSFFINGHKADNPQDYNGFKQLVEAELK